MTDQLRSDDKSRPCNCVNGDECYGDYPPKGIKCRDLEPTDPGIDTFGPDTPDMSDDEIEEQERRCGKD